MVSLVNKTAWDSRMVPVVMGKGLDGNLMCNSLVFSPSSVEDFISKLLQRVAAPQLEALITETL